jgi:hypothetical protein
LENENVGVVGGLVIQNEGDAAEPEEHGRGAQGPRCCGEATGSLVPMGQEQLHHSGQILLRAVPPAELFARWGVEVEAPRVWIVLPVPGTKKVIAL